MRAKKPSSNNAAAEARRLLAALVVIAGVLWGLNAVRAGAEDQAADQAAGPTQVAVLPADPEPLLGAGRTGMDKLVSLDLRSTEATDALKYLAMQGELNISISNAVQGRVNLLLNNVPIRDVFDLILRSNELAYDKRTNVYHVMTEAEYRALYGRKFSDMREVRTFRLQYASPQQAFNLLDTLKSDVGRLLVDEESGTVMVMETPEKVREMEQALSVLEQQGDTKVIDLKYAKAKDIEERLKDELEANKLGYVKADERSNQLIVKTLPERMKQVEMLIHALDRKTREVFIDAKIVKVAYIDGMDTGVDWDQVFTNLKFHGVDQVGDFRNTTAGTAPTEVPAVTKMKLPFVGNNDKLKLGSLAFGTVARDGYELFRYLETVGRTKIISNPKLMVTENQEAKILVGTREAYITTTTTSGQTTATTAEDVEFIDVGIQLAVTPTINQDGFVTMKIKPEISSVVRTLTTPSNNQIPIVDTSTAETTVMVADGTSVIIGGLRKNEKKSTEEQIPHLGKIPLLGKTFFKKTDREDQLTELIVFITPHIVGGEKLVTGDEDKSTSDGFKAFRDYRAVRGGGQ
jgi:type II secretory pathway component GspD/PulD (secretin)